jgi:hypothetical protein
LYFIYSILIGGVFFFLALYPYSANGRYELSLAVGEQLKLEEEISGLNLFFARFVSFLHFKSTF